MSTSVDIFHWLFRMSDQTYPHVFAYTLAFIKRGDQILMVNREKKPWLGSWNGVGGKKTQDEDPLSCIKREILEETGIAIDNVQIIYKGYLTWNTFDANGNGLYLYLVNVPNDFIYETPIKTKEGILDWKSIDWILDTNNYGLAHNIQYFLPKMLNHTENYHYHCVFENQKLVEVTWEII
jgi:8-oxo-dGTP diphosphatase